MENLKDLLVEELKDIYSAEKQIVKALPKMVKGADSTELKTALTEHLEVTKEHVIRLEEVFSHVEQKAKAKHCKGMEGLLTEGADFLEEGEAGALRDLQIIGAAQRVEHYEMAAYGTARAMAEHLQLAEVVDLLSQTFDEEEEADHKLTDLAESLYGEVAGGTPPDELSGEDDESEGEDAMTEATVPATSKRKGAMASSRS